MNKLAVVTLKPKKRVAQKRKTSKQISIKKLNQEPISYAFKTQQKGPKFGFKDGCATVSHTEYLLDIYANSSDYNCGKIPINPGLSGPFPWLSRIAANWEAFKFEKLVFSYKPAAPTTTKGTILMVSDPNPLNPIPESKTDFLQMKGAVTTNVFKLLNYAPIQKDFNLEANYYVRTQEPGNNEDLRLYDPCNFFIAYWGCESGSTLGELHVSYVVKLIKPTLRLGKQLTSQTESWALKQNGVGVSANYPLGSGDFISTAIGKFTEAGMKYLKGSSSGHLFGTTKFISKVISTMFNLGSAWVSGGVPGLVLSVLKQITGGNSTYLQNNSSFFVDSSTDVLALYDSKPELFEEDTEATKDVSALGRCLLAGNMYVIQQQEYQLKPGQLLQITWDKTANNISPAGVRSFVMTDKMKDVESQS